MVSIVVVKSRMTGLTHARARMLRRSMTRQERKLWQALRDGGLNGLKFRRQMPIGRYVVDFAHCPSRLIIELDGGQHTVQRDADRTAFLECEGWRVLRFWNTEIETAFDGVLLAIAREAGCPLE